MSLITDTTRHHAGVDTEALDTLDQLAVNTIRTLAMDAVQQAKSGHPGTPMALAPVVYCLWQRVLRFDPDHPIWPNRDRFVLSVGHASMLLYSLLHLTGVKAVNPKYETLGQPSVTLDDIKRFRQLDSKCAGPSGIPLDVGRRDDNRAARTGGGDERRHGHRRALDGELFQSSRLRPVRLRRLRPVRRRLHDGRRSPAKPRRSPGISSSANLCWIYDNNHITIEGNTALSFSDDVATRFVGYGWNVTRVGDANDLDDARARVQHVQANARSTHADHRGQPHRLRRAEQTGYERRSRRAARRGRGPARQASLRLAGRREVPGPRRACASISRPASAHAARRCIRRGGRCSRNTGARIPSSPTRAIACCGASCPTTGSEGLPVFPARRQGHRHARCVGQGAERRRRQRALADRRLGGSRPVVQDAADHRRRRATSAPRILPGAISTSASASTPWPPCSMACRCPRYARSDRAS